MTVHDDYVAMEPMLNAINGKFIALPQDEIDENNSFLNQLLDTIIAKMRARNKLFDSLFKHKFHGGSYWDRVKVSKPDEYDVHVQMVLESFSQKLVPSDTPGWVNLKFERQKNPTPVSTRRSRRKPYFGTPGLHVLINEEGYLDTEKVMIWFHQTLSEALGGFKIFKYRYCEVEAIEMKFRRHGPAFTFSIKDQFDNKKRINIDFVPCFLFREDQYPVDGFQKNPTEKGETFIVAKPIKSEVGTRYWRLSFQIQERELMRNLEKFKPVLKLLKKMRDKLNHKCIASYFIKNVMLLEIRRRDESFWKNSLSFVFMSVLKFYQKCIENGRIDFYWYSEDNLIAGVSADDLKSINNKLIGFINEVDEDPKNVELARYFLTRREFEQFKEDFIH